MNTTNNWHLAHTIERMAGELEALAAQLAAIERRTSTVPAVQPAPADLATVAKLDAGYEVDHGQYAWDYVAAAAEAAVAELPLNRIDADQLRRVARGARAAAGHGTEDSPRGADEVFWADVQLMTDMHAPQDLATPARMIVETLAKAARRNLSQEVGTA